MKAIGLDLGGTQIKAVLVRAEGEILRRELRATRDDDFAATLRAVADELDPTAPVGVSAPGLVRSDGRAIGWLPNRLPGLENFDWTNFLARGAFVPVMNDAHAALLGEGWRGAARGLRDAILLTLGTGVGGAILSEGRILRGHRGRAGHLGHLCLDLDGPPSIVGMPGALEVFCGNYNILERTEGRFATTHALIAAFLAGDVGAEKYWRRSLRALAAAIASFVNILDPEAVLLGGGIAQAGEALFGPLADELAKVEWRPNGAAVRLLPAQLGEWAGALGAAKTALDHATAGAAR
jgi:glucokinase